MKKEFLAAVIALILTVSSAAVFSGCGCNNDKKDQQTTTAPSTTVQSTTQDSTRSSSKRATQPNTQNATNGQSDPATLALNSYGVSASEGYSAVQSGATNNVEGTFNIYAIYDADGDFKTYVYIHTSGYPIYVGQDVFESVHNGNSVDNQGGDSQDNDNSQGGQDDGGNQSSANNQSSNQGGGNNGGGNQNYGGGGNQGGDGHDYADKGY